MKVFIIIVGVLIALMGGSCLAAGATLGATVGTDGWIESDDGTLDTTTHALVSEVADIANEDEDAAEFFDEVEFRLRVTVESPDEEVFVGVGPAGEVTAYLSGVEHEVLNDLGFSPLETDGTVIPGTREPGPPGDETFWVQQVSGPGEQELDWDIQAGSYRFVLMNADGSAGIDSQAKFALKIPFATGIMIGLLVAGGTFLLIGIVTVVLAIRSGRSKPPAASSQAGGEPPPEPQQPPPESTPAQTEDPSPPG
jgi:hypothetical protein